MSEIMNEKEKLVDQIVRANLINIQNSGAGYFHIDPRTYSKDLPSMAILNCEYARINEHKSGMSSSQRRKVIALYEHLNPKPKVTK